MNEDSFLKELLAMFKIESEEHIKSMSSGLLEMEKITDSDQKLRIIETVYREAHSLKGAARAVSLLDVESLCQSLESLFALIKSQELEPDKKLYDFLHRAVDSLTDLVESPGKQDITEIKHELERAEIGIFDADKFKKKKEEKTEKKLVVDKEMKEVPSSETEPTKPEKIEPVQEKEPAPGPDQKAQFNKDKSVISETIRVSTSKLDSILLQIEEMLAAKLTASQHAENLRDTVLKFDIWKKEWERRSPEVRAIRRQLEKLEDQRKEHVLQTPSNKLLEYLDWHLDQMHSFGGQLIPLSKIADTNSRQLGSMVDHILEDMKKVLMLPFSTLLKILPKVVRDLSRDQTKEVELVVRGSTIEVDRRILEELKDPFIHLLRNCIDHGIEKPEERKKNHKASCGMITISISQMTGSMVEILISDDGGGINPEKVKNVAVKRGLISESESKKMTEQEKLALIYLSDISTSPLITDISGRGLGLAIVREKVENLGGKITLDTTIGMGTTFRIVLPVTLATFRGILIRVCEHLFVLPTSHVERVLRIKTEEIKSVENKDTVSIDGRAVSFVRMEDVLELERRTASKINEEYTQLIVLNAAKKRIAFSVDEIINEQEVLVKGFGEQLARVRNIAGSTIFGSGKVVLILNVTDVMKTAVKAATLAIRREIKKEETVLKKNILIAEDSITSRTLLKNIIESAGYKVKTTVDGLDAFNALGAEDFDLVVSDIEMPRMSGFDLVSKIRSSDKISDLPVILVTGLESKEHRERGIDVGANAYIVKRSFDQSNLLEVIKKLI